MRMPRKPPTLSKIVEKFPSGRLMEIFDLKEVGATKKYLHWDKLIHLSPPAGLSHEEWWLVLKFGRGQLLKEIPLQDKEGKHFNFMIPDSILEQLHNIDLGAGGHIGVPEPITNPDTRDQYFVSSLIEEAITSSQLEGATTTRKVAKEMIRAGRPARDRSERMILNNFLTMQRIGNLKQNPLTQELIFEIHRLVTHETWSGDEAAGRFRRPDEPIVIGNEENEVFHTPPKAEELEKRMDIMCDFANGKTPGFFIHPVIRSIMLHFWLAYDHPFVDGNGRTARALFYWAMLRNGFWLSEYISISHILLKAPAKYSRSFLYTETDDNDLTYFILYQVEVIRKALEELHQYIEKRAAKVRTMEHNLHGIIMLNHRQRALISHALRHPNIHYSIEGHRLSHNVAYQTARTDLLNLVERKLFNSWKTGKTWYFRAEADIESKLASLE